MSPAVQDACQVALVAIIGALASFIVRYLNRKEQALDFSMKREAAFDAAARIETRVQAGDTLSSNSKLAMALELANATTPSRIEVKAADIEIALPRVRASLASTSVAPPSLPPDVEIVETPTLPRPAPMPRDTTREKAPLR